MATSTKDCVLLNCIFPRNRTKMRVLHSQTGRLEHNTWVPRFCFRKTSTMSNCEYTAKDSSSHYVLQHPLWKSSLSCCIRRDKNLILFCFLSTITLISDPRKRCVESKTHMYVSNIMVSDLLCFLGFLGKKSGMKHELWYTVPNSNKIHSHTFLGASVTTESVSPGGCAITQESLTYAVALSSSPT